MPLSAARLLDVPRRPEAAEELGRHAAERHAAVQQPDEQVVDDVRGFADDPVVAPIFGAPASRRDLVYERSALDRARSASTVSRRNKVGKGRSALPAVERKKQLSAPVWHEGPRGSTR